MQKAIIVVMVLILSSCTIARKQKPVEFGLELFDPIDKSTTVYQNKRLKIKFITCRKQWITKPSEARKYFRSEFKKKYGVEVLGLSNLVVEATHVIDSSMHNEVCHRITGNPVTKNKMETVKEEYWELTNPAHHVH